MIFGNALDYIIIQCHKGSIKSSQHFTDKAQNGQAQQRERQHQGNTY